MMGRFERWAAQDPFTAYVVIYLAEVVLLFAFLGILLLIGVL